MAPSHDTAHTTPHPAMHRLEAGLFRISSRLASPGRARYSPSRATWTAALEQVAVAVVSKRCLRVLASSNQQTVLNLPRTIGTIIMGVIRDLTIAVIRTEQ